MLELRDVSARDKSIYDLGGISVENAEHAKEKISESLWSIPYFSLAACVGIALVLVLYYLKFIKAFVFLPADILMWAETNFVGDIIKLRIGAPIYTTPSDSNSFIYTPGAPMLTYLI